MLAAHDGPEALQVDLQTCSLSHASGDVEDTQAAMGHA
jgi:hypothetical protein